MNKNVSMLEILSVVFLAASCGGKSSSSLASVSSSAPASSEEESLSSSSGEAKLSFSVALRNEAGEAMKGYKVQWCTTTNCFLPVSVDEAGVATALLPAEGTYTVHVKNSSLQPLTEYAYDPNQTEDKDKRNLDLTLYSYSSLVDGKITKEGVYLLSLEAEGSVEIPLALGEGHYSVESWANQNPVDGDVYDPKVTVGSKSDDNSGTGKNFLLSFDGGETSLKVSSDKAGSFAVRLVRK